LGSSIVFLTQQINFSCLQRLSSKYRIIKTIISININNQSSLFITEYISNIEWKYESNKTKRWNFKNLNSSSSFIDFYECKNEWSPCSYTASCWFVFDFSKKCSLFLSSVYRLQSLLFVKAKQAAITDDDCIAMIKSIFSDVYVQSLPQSNRYNVFVILLHFLLNRLESMPKNKIKWSEEIIWNIFVAVQQLKSDFVCNFIQSMDGERDPRNLVLCFQCLQYMTKYLEIGKQCKTIWKRNFYFYSLQRTV